MKDTEKYKKLLEESLVELEAELKTIGVHNPKNESDWIAVPEGTGSNESDLNEAADKVEEWGERRATVAVLETRYNNLVLALKKIEDGTYGVCEISGEEVEGDRLDANPAARTNKAHMNDESSLLK